MRIIEKSVKPGKKVRVIEEFDAGVPKIRKNEVNEVKIASFFFNFILF